MNDGYCSDLFQNNRIYDAKVLKVEQKNDGNFTVHERFFKDQMVAKEGKFYKCDCADYLDEPKNCKHIIAVRSFLQDPLLEDTYVPVELNLPKRASSKEKIDYIIRELKAHYFGKNKKLFSWHEFEIDNPSLRGKTLNSWAKETYGRTAFEIFIEEGIISQKKKFDFSQDIELVSAEMLLGKRVYLYKDAQCELFKAFGAILVASDSDKIDYVFLGARDDVKSDPIDESLALYNLFLRRENNEISFKVISNMSIPSLQEELLKQKLSKCNSDKEVAELGIKIRKFTDSEGPESDIQFKIVNAIDRKMVPEYQPGVAYLTSAEYIKRFAEHGGELRFATTAEFIYDKEPLERESMVKKEIEVFKKMCDALNNPEVVKYIIGHVVKKSDGTLYKNRVLKLHSFRFIFDLWNYTTLIAKNISDTEIEVSIKNKPILRNIGDQDYELLETPEETDAELLLKARINTCDNQDRYLVISSVSNNIPEFCFANNQALEYVVLSTGIKSIDRYAFYNCRNLKEIVFNNDLERISENAFENCISLEEIGLAKSVHFISNEAFTGCDNLNPEYLP